MSYDKYQSYEAKLVAKPTPQDKWKLWVALGIAVVMGGAYLLYKRRNRHPDENKIYQIKRLIGKSFSVAQPNLCPLTPQRTKTITDENISINIHYISQLQNKNRTNLSATRNPFLPPFQKGLMIAELPPKHRLLYNKFYFYRNHLLVVTQEFEQQFGRLNVQDLKQTLLTAHAINGLFFYNCGHESGFSQKHKHMQVLPNEAFKLPIVAEILSDITTDKLEKINYKSSTNIPIFLFKGFPFIHGIVVMPENINSEHLEQAAIEFKKAEDTLFTHLSLLLKMKNFSYNIIGCSKFLMIIPRKNERVMNEIGVNAIIFMGSMLIKDSKLFDKVEHLWKPSNILRQLTYTEIPKQ